MSVQNVTNFLQGIPELGGSNSVSSAEKNQKPFDLGQSISNGIDAVNKDLTQASKVSEDFMNGKPHDLHEVMILMEKADISFRFMTQIRNKVLDAYNDVMRMQV